MRHETEKLRNFEGKKNLTGVPRGKDGNRKMRGNGVSPFPVGTGGEQIKTSPYSTGGRFPRPECIIYLYFLPKTTFRLRQGLKRLRPNSDYLAQLTEVLKNYF